jgi:P27 family predicted phage terminase small subunit
MAGRRPTPEALKDLAGRPGKRPAKKVLRSKLKAYCPDWLGDEAKREWQRMAPELELLGLLSSIDQQSFAAYCHSYALFRQAAADVAANGITYRTDGGQVKKNPAVEIMRQAGAEMRKFMVEHGLTPATRARVQPLSPQMGLPGIPEKPSVPKPQEDNDRFFGARLQ